MAKTILVPIDFKVESLNTLKFALAEQEEPIHVILLYGNILSDSITELLFYSPHKYIAELMTKEFEEALAIIKNRFTKNILYIHIELFNAPSTGLLRNLVQHHKIDAIYVPKNYALKLGKSGFDPVPYLKKMLITQHEIEWSVQAFPDESDQLQALFS